MPGPNGFSEHSKSKCHQNLGLAGDTLLALVLSFTQPLKHAKPGLFRVRNRNRFRRIKCGPNPSHRLFAGWTIRQRPGWKGPMQREPTAANGATTFAELVLVQWHKRKLEIRSSKLETITNLKLATN